MIKYLYVRRAADAGYAPVVELADTMDLGAVTLVKGFAVPFVARSPKTKYAPVMELVDMRDLGAVTLVKVLVIGVQ